MQNIKKEIVGGGVERAINGEEVLSAKNIITDGVSGFVGGAVGAKLTSSFDGGTASSATTKNIITQATTWIVKKGIPSAVKGLSKFLVKQAPKIFGDDSKTEDEDTSAWVMVNPSHLNPDGSFTDDALIFMVDELETVTVTPDNNVDK